MMIIIIMIWLCNYVVTVSVEGQFATLMTSTANFCDFNIHLLFTIADSK